MIGAIFIGACALLLLFFTPRGTRISKKELDELKSAKRFADMVVHKGRKGELHGVNADGSPIKWGKP